MSDRTNTQKLMNSLSQIASVSFGEAFGWSDERIPPNPLLISRSIRSLSLCRAILAKRVGARN